MIEPGKDLDRNHESSHEHDHEELLRKGLAIFCLRSSLLSQELVALTTIVRFWKKVEKMNEEIEIMNFEEKRVDRRMHNRKTFVESEMDVRRPSNGRRIAQSFQI